MIEFLLICVKFSEILVVYILLKNFNFFMNMFRNSP